MDPASLRVVRRAIDHPDARALVSAVQQVYVDLYGGEDATPIEPGHFDPPDGSFFVGYLGDRPVASGAWRMRPDVAEELGMASPAEIKRMYVESAARGHGLARRVLAHLELTAREAGATHLVLETGEPQVEAIGLYTAAGYTPIAPFGHYRCAPEVRCFARRLG